MWQSIATAVLHTAVHGAVQRSRSSATGGPQKRDPDDEGEKKKPSISGWVVLGIVLGSCCLSSGLLSVFGSALALFDNHRPHEGDPVAAIVSSAFLCIAPSLLALTAAFFSIRRTRRMQRLVALAEARDALSPEDVARALDTDPATAKVLLDAAIAEGFIDRAIVEATEPHGSKDELVHEARPAQVATVNAFPPRPVKIEAPAAAPPTGGHVRVCPFCKASVTVVETPGTRPRCTSCGIPFSSKV